MRVCFRALCGMRDRFESLIEICSDCVFSVLSVVVRTLL